jgi:uncharacterized protein YqhQ
MTEKLPSYGGQAVIEGVMMRGGKSVAIAMRDPDQQIVIHTEELGGIYKSRLAKIPFLRGLVILWDALGLGMRALTISANTQTGEDEKLEGPALYLTLGTSIIIMIALFMLLPAQISSWVAQYFGWNIWWTSLLEGMLRLLLVVGYIWGIGNMAEIKRVFAYHGAEHKTINAFEDGADLTPEVVSTYPLEHARCGTAFLLTLVLISVLLFTLIAPLKPEEMSKLLWNLITRVALVPVLAALAYEYIRWTATHMHWAFVRWLIKPNLALQRLTTREPSLDIVEVGIAAFQAMRAAEQKQQEIVL